MSGFRAVNTTTLTLQDPAPGKLGDETTPTTPRPHRFFQHEQSHDDSRPADDPSAKTPTRDSFNGIAGQRPLPSAPYTPPLQETKIEHLTSAPARRAMSRESSHRSTKSLDSQDINMDEEEDETREPTSDNESATSDSTRPAKKKKGQRFFCTDFPPCQLSFTRSEHLARHIRKHTGERPFQCHCSRRFSRLDNLRQHAQTVHVNEDIPGDSLAATGTRFQRQIRTDRVRAPNRSRASTLGSTGSHSRGHSRNLSTSSIASTTSTVSTMSQISQQDDFRRRPAPLAMAAGGEGRPRSRLSLDTFTAQVLGGSPGPVIYNNPPQSPTGYNTPPSGTYSPATGSPRFPSGLQSPISSVNRGLGFGGAPKTHARRLSVPSTAANTFQPPPTTYGQPSFITSVPSGSSSHYTSPNSSVYGFPTVNAFSGPAERRESSAEADWRRRTWHPSTYTGIGQQRPATSGLSYYQTPDSPNPARAEQKPLRLPGIESFDHVPPVPALPNRVTSPMQVDPPQQVGDAALQTGLRKLEIATPDSRGEQLPPQQAHHLSWGPYQPHHQQTPPQLPSLRSHDSAPALSQSQPHHAPPVPTLHPHHAAAPVTLPPPSQEVQTAPLTAFRHSDEPTTPRRNKRHGWYNGPLPQTQLAAQTLQQPQPAPYAQYANGPAPLLPSQGPPVLSHPQIQTQYPAFSNSRPSPEDSSSSDGGVPTPSSSNQGEWNRPATAEEQQHAPIHRSDMASWSLQGAQMESRKRDREERDRIRDSGVGEDVTMAGAAAATGGAHGGDMRRLEALVAVATGEGRA